MPTSCLIVCERTGRWAVAFRRALGKREIAILESRSLSACESPLAENPAAIVAVEATASNLEAVLVALPKWQRRFADCRIIVLAAAELAAAEHLLREAGAMSVLYSTRHVPAAANLVVRHGARCPATEQPLESLIQNRLPWQRAASAPA